SPKPPEAPPRNDPAPAVRADRFGDPLPAGVVARLGTTRFRHGNGATAAFSADGRSLQSFGRDRAIRTWDAPTGRLIREQHLRPGSFVPAAALSPDGRLLGSTDGTVRDATTGEVRLRLGVEGKMLWKPVAFSPDGAYFAAGVWLKITRPGVQGQ